MPLRLSGARLERTQHISGEGNVKGDLRIGRWLVQPQLNSISDSDTKVRVEPKAMEVLVCLAEHTDEVLSKDRIIQAVWPDTFVTDNALTTSISQLRKAFQDNPQRPAVIETISGRGYRLIVPVSPATEDLESGVKEERLSQSGPQGRSLHIPRLAWVLVFGVLVATPILWIWKAGPQPVDPGPIDSIAVLPLDNVTEDPENDYLSMGIAGTISSGLTRLPNVRVIPSSSLLRYKREDVDARTVADEQKVRGVVMGTLHYESDSLIVSVELVDAAENRLAWGGQYTRPFSDVFSMQKEISREIARALRLQLTPDQEKEVTGQPTDSPAAYDALLRGHYLWENWNEDPANLLQKAIDLYEEAIRIDPWLAEAYLGKARVHFFRAQATGSGRPDDYQQARTAFRRAIELDAGSAESHKLRAEILWRWDKDWGAAEREYGEAVDLDPNMRKDFFYLLWLGRRSEALEELDRQVLESDRLSLSAITHEGWSYFIAGEVDRATELGEKAVELNPEATASYWLLMFCYDVLGRDADFLNATLSAVEKTPERLERTRRAYQLSGRSGVWRLSIDQIDEIGTPRPHDLAFRYARVGDLDTAFEWLEKAADLPLGQFPPTHPSFQPLLDDPRWEAFLRKINLPEDAIARHMEEKD